MRQKMIDGVLVTKPTREDIISLKVGDMAPDCFNGMRKVVEIFACREDIHGKMFVCYYTEFGPTSRMSNSMKEDEILSTTALTNKFRQAALVDQMPW